MGQALESRLGQPADQDSRYDPPGPKELHAEKLEIHYAPKHNSWLNMAQIELSVLTRQCITDYCETRKQLVEQIAARERSGNESKTGIDWRFTTSDARIKLERLCPAM